MQFKPRRKTILYAAGLLLTVLILTLVAVYQYQGASANRPFFALSLPSLEEEDLRDSLREGAEEVDLEEPPVELPDVNPDVPAPDPIESITEGSELQVSHWIYPGPPACDTYAELRTLEQVDEVKPEFATITADGSTAVLTENEAGCNALSSTNVDFYKQVSETQFITVSGSGEGFSNLVTDPTKRQESIDVLVPLVEQTDMTGIELDFEGYSGWSEADYAGYLTFLQDLGDALRANNRQLMIDAPAIYNDGIQSVFQFRYEDFNNLPVDYVAIMAYDYQYDYGGGSPVTEDQFLIDAIDRAKAELTDWENRLVVGLPTYGYTAAEGEYRINILTRDQVFERLSEAEISQATRIPNSEELIYRKDGQVYVWQDQQSIEHKIGIVQDQGINRIAIWHLGGNPLVATE